MNFARALDSSRLFSGCFSLLLILPSIHSLERPLQSLVLLITLVLRALCCPFASLDTFFFLRIKSGLFAPLYQQHLLQPL